MTMKKKEIIHEVRRYFVILFGCAVCGVGINLFILPANLLTSGLGGIAILLHYFVGWPVGAQLLVYNLPILYLAHRFVGKRYAVDTILGTVLFSLGIDAFSPLSALHPVHDTMLNAIFGGVVSGIGYGVIFRFGSNTGGVDVFGAILKKYWSIDVGTGVFLLNMLVIAASAALFDLETALFTLVCIYATAELTNRWAAGFNREKAIFIISEESEKIGDAIMESLHRGVTYIEGRGGFLQEKKAVVFVVVSLTQLARVKAICDRLDKNAFLIIANASEVRGRGFSRERILYQFAQRKELIEAREREKGGTRFKG